ncbi:MAG: segregation/condensation protein A [Verrucomicrobia bacterium]|nr:segregation/condensation protein A [Verrucomicrobiota bacterium]
MVSGQEDGLTRAVEHPITLPVFEGPLDLLLFLIRRNEIDIYDIPIETVTRQYLEVLRQSEPLELDSAGDFFVMAATLMYIKSKMLLPREEQKEEEGSDDEGVDPRWELVQQLLQYRKFKDAAYSLESLIEKAQNLLFREVRSEDVIKPEQPLKPTDRLELWNTFNLVLRRLAEKSIVGEIHAETVTVADRMEALIELLHERTEFKFSELFTGVSYSQGYIVATFWLYLN